MNRRLEDGEEGVEEERKRQTDIETDRHERTTIVVKAKRKP